MARAPARPSPPSPAASSCATGWWSVLRFTLCTILLSGALTALATPWVDLPLWRIFRRCASIGAALSLWICITRLDRRPVSSFGLSGGREGVRIFGAGVLLGAGTLAVMLGLGLATGACRIAITPDQAKLWRTLLTFIPGAAIVSVLEELVFRGYLLQHLRACSTAAAVIISSAAYSLVHLKSPEWTVQTWMELSGLFLLGALLSFTVLRTRRLHLAIGLHASLAYGARVNKLLIEFSETSDAWLTGTSRLVNGVSGWLALLAIGGIVWWRTRRIQGRYAR